MKQNKTRTVPVDTDLIRVNKRLKVSVKVLAAQNGMSMVAMTDLVIATGLKALQK